MSELAAPPRRLLLALGIVTGVGVAAVIVGSDLAGEGYALWPLSANAAGVLQRASRAALVATVGVWTITWLPWRWALTRERSRAALAWIWALVPCVLAWAWWGYRFNRYTAAPQWKHVVERWGIELPEAMVHGPTLGRNLAATVLALVAALALFVVWRRLLPSSRRDLPGLRGARLLLALWLLIGLVGAVLPAQQLRPRASGPDIVLISLDAVRADYLGAYGHPDGLTPSLDAFATESERFTRAYSQEPWTLTSHMSMLSGLYPDVHGLDFGRSLPPEIWTVAERLRDAGYRTAATVYDCFLLSPRFGYAAGFDEYEESGVPAAQRCIEAAEWLLARDRPSFLFLHLYDPHSDTSALPYAASDADLARFAPRARELFLDWAGPDGASEALRRVNESELQLTPEQRDAIPALYAAGLYETDRAVGDFLRRLKEGRRFDDALIIVTSDHGEALGERGHFMHEELMEATLRVPLLIHWPGGARAAATRDSLVELVDIAPTLLETAGLHSESISQGRSLVSPDGPRRNFAFHRSGPDYAITTSDRWRLHYRFEGGVDALALRRVDGSGADGIDLLGSEWDRAAAWFDIITRLHEANATLASSLRGATVSMSEADLELLRSLGYID